MTFYSLDKARDLVIEAGLRLQREGLIVRTWGNISARISETQYVITPSGRSYDSLKREDIVIVNIHDNSYIGSIKPSSERPVHSAVYRESPEAGFVIHTHQSFASALSVLGKDFEDIYCASYGPNGSEMLSNAVQKVLHEQNGIKSLLMKNHGAIGFGHTIEEAFEEIGKLEDKSKRICSDLLMASNYINDSFSEKDMEEALRRGIQLVETSETALKLQTPFIKLISYTANTNQTENEAFARIAPYIDDQAQILGTFLPLISETSDSDLLTAILNEYGVVLFRGDRIDSCYALVKTSASDDTEAAAFILDKSCLAAAIASSVPGTPPLDPLYAEEDRRAYIESYSKLMITNV